MSLEPDAASAKAGMKSDTARILTLVGAAMLAVGVFMPVLDVPKRGTMSLMQVEWAGVITLVLAAAAAAAALIGWTRHALWPGVGALGLLGYAYQRTNAEIARSRARLNEGIGEDPFAAVRDLAASNSRIEYGWAVLALGAALIVVGGLLAWRAGRRGRRLSGGSRS